MEISTGNKQSGNDNSLKIQEEGREDGKVNDALQKQKEDEESESPNPEEEDKEELEYQEEMRRDDVSLADENIKEDEEEEKNGEEGDSLENKIQLKQTSNIQSPTQSTELSPKEPDEKGLSRSQQSLKQSTEKPPKQSLDFPLEPIKIEHKKKKSVKSRVRSYVKRYFMKMKGDPKRKPKRSPIKEWIYSWFVAMIGISVVGVMHYNLVKQYNLEFIIGSFGASAVLIYGAPTSPLAQPRNFIGGHLVCAIVGVTTKWIFQGQILGIACGFGVATSIFFMHVTSTVHPPGGATALIAIMTPFFTVGRISICAHSCSEWYTRDVADSGAFQ